MDRETQKQWDEEQATITEEEFARSLVPPPSAHEEQDAFMSELLDNTNIIVYLEEKIKGQIWDGKKLVQKYPPLLTNTGVNGILAVSHPISDKHNAISYYDEEDVMEIMYHLMNEIDEFLCEKWQEVGLVENPELPLVRIGKSYYQLKPIYPNIPTDRNQEYYLKHLNDYEVIEPVPSLSHYNLIRGIVRRIAYATIKKSYKGLLIKTIKTQVSVLEQTRTNDYNKKQGGMMDFAKKFPLFK